MQNDDPEELRLALVMNGGVSLAVWMGGVTNEIARLVCPRQQDEVYAGLLKMTATRARVDVISGTSAGGINGAALSVAMLYGGDFASLRDVWLDVGDFGTLLRQPASPNPGSLLNGDGTFLQGLERGLAKLIPLRSKARDAAECPVDLRLTTTLLQGEVGRHVDALGTPISDVSHRAFFHFQHRPETSNLQEPDKLIPLLARAARSTASFPFAFEPSMIEQAELRLKGEDGLPLTQKGTRFVVDGGVLDNKPFRGALQAIFSMPRQGGVRRVLAYINPDPGSEAQSAQEAKPDDQPERADAADTPSTGAKGKAKPPPLANVLSASLLGIPQAQSIGDQLRSIEQHNDKVRGRREAILTLISAFEGPKGQVDAVRMHELAARLFKVYRTRRLVNTFELFVWPEALKADARLRAHRQERKQAQPEQRLGKRQRDWLMQAFLSKGWEKWLPLSWPTPPDGKPDGLTTPSANQPDSWQWGMFPVEFAARLMLDILRRVQALSWHDQTTPDLPARLAALWGTANALTAKVVQKRESEQRNWLTGGNALIAALPRWQGKIDDAADHLQHDLLAFLEDDARRAFCGQAAHDIAQVVWQAARLASQVVQGAKATQGADRHLRAPDRSRADELALLAHYLAPAQPDAGSAKAQTLGPAQPDKPEVLATLERLLQLEVIEYAFVDHDDLNNDTLIELVQISGNAQSPLGGPDRAPEKLLGLQLAHFAAFYKQSWRANDWLYGRLDGASRLVRILLNPERLYQRYAGSGIDALIADLQGLIVNGHLPGPHAKPDGSAGPKIDLAALQAVMADAWRDTAQADLRKELAFVADMHRPLPDNLPLCTELLTKRLHYRILMGELPVLSRAIESDRKEDAAASRHSTQVLQQVGATLDEAQRRKGVKPPEPVAPAIAAELLGKGLIASERLGTEAGSDLFTRTIGHTLAAFQSTIAVKAAGFGPIGALFAALRTPFFLFYVASQVLTRQSRTRAALHGGLLLAGLTMVLAPFALSVGADKVPAWWQGLAWSLLAMGMLFSLLRTPLAFSVALLTWGGVMLWLLPQKALLLLGIVLALSLPFILRRVTTSVLGALAMMGLGAVWSAGYTSWAGLLGGIAKGPWPERLATSTVAFGGLMALVMLLAVFESSAWGQRVEQWLQRGLRCLGKQPKGKVKEAPKAGRRA